jgi:hypothetical protein
VRNCNGTTTEDYSYVSAKSGARFDRCPKAWLEGEPEASMWVADAMWFIRWRQLPSAGGMLDQDTRCLRVVDIVGAELRAADVTL